MWIACDSGRAEHLSLLIGADADVNTPDRRSGRTPVCTTCANGRAKCVSLLVAAGADIHRPDRSGRTPVHIAASGGMLSTVLLLTKHGADITVRNGINESISDVYGRDIVAAYADNDIIRNNVNRGTVNVINVDDDSDDDSDIDYDSDEPYIDYESDDSDIDPGNDDRGRVIVPDDNNVRRRITDTLARLKHVAIIEDAYRREQAWRRRKDYMIFAHGMMRYDNSNTNSSSNKDAHMIKVYTVFEIRHVHESVASFI